MPQRVEICDTKARPFVFCNRPEGRCGHGQVGIGKRQKDDIGGRESEILRRGGLIEITALANDDVH